MQTPPPHTHTHPSGKRGGFPRAVAGLMETATNAAFLWEQKYRNGEGNLQKCFSLEQTEVWWISSSSAPTLRSTPFFCLLLFQEVFLKTLKIMTAQRKSCKRLFFERIPPLTKLELLTDALRTQVRRSHGPVNLLPEPALQERAGSRAGFCCTR